MISFWLLDIWSRVEDGVETVHLWGYDDNGKRIELVDSSVRPFLISDPFDPEILSDLKGIENIDLEEVVKKHGLGNKTFVKVLAFDASEDIPRVKRRLNEAGIITYEDDIYYTQVYMKQRGFKPCSWHIIAGEKKEEVYNSKFDLEAKTCIDISKARVQWVEDYTLPDVKPMSLDIECYGESGGMPKVEKDPIILFGLRFGKSNTMIAKKDGVSSDDGLIREVREDIISKDPHVIATYNGNEFDWDYIMDRCEVGGLNFNISPFGRGPHKTEYSTIAINGRPTIDLFGIAKFVVPKGNRKTQPVVHSELAKANMVPERKFKEIDRDNIAALWDNRNKRPDVIAHCEDDVTFTDDIFDYAWPFVIELSRLTGIPPDEVLDVPYYILVEGFLMQVAKDQNVLIPHCESREQPKTSGAVCMEPIKGLMENVAVFDFQSMYPNILVDNNISPETFVEKPLPGKTHIIDTDLGEKLYFLKEPEGFFAIAMKKLLHEIDLAKNRYKDKKYTQKYAGEVQALKTIARSMYGYLKAPKSRWALYKAQEAVASEGRNRVLIGSNVAEDYGYENVYIDTDSLFLRGLKEEDCEEFANVLSEEIGSKVSLDKYYKLLFFTEAKKKYAGIDSKGHKDYVGFTKSDWMPLANRVQIMVLDEVLEHRNPQHAAKMVADVISGIRNGIYPVRDFIIWKKVRRDLSEYSPKSKSAHLEVAKRNPEVFIEEDGTVGYLIIPSPGKLYQRAVHYTEVKDSMDLDLDYYITNQINAVAGRILQYFTGEKDFERKEYFNAL